MNDFTTFVSKSYIGPLAWLGKYDWLESGASIVAEERAVWARATLPKISPEEKQKYSHEHWKTVETIINYSKVDIVNAFFNYALSKSLAFGPKVFQPTTEDCEALENTACTIRFEDYKQPYPCIIIEIPKEYREKLASAYKIKEGGPLYVVIHHNSVNGFITVNAFFNKENVICHITPMRPEYKTIEDAIIKNRSYEQENDIQAAEIVQRLAINLCMVMVLLGVKNEGPLDPIAFKKAKSLSKDKQRHKAVIGKKLLEATLYKLAFIEQKIKLYDEEIITPSREGYDHERASPKPHWRRGHYRHQPCGPKQSERTLIFIKPVFVRAAVFSGDLKNTHVTYTIGNK